MTQTLWNVTRKDNGAFLMTAALSTVQRLYGLRDEAIDRVTREIGGGKETVDLFGNGRHEDIVLSIAPTPKPANSDEYSGWANKESWLVCIYIDNDQGSYTTAREIAASAASDFAAGDAIEDAIEEGELLGELPTEGFIADMLNNALGRVDWAAVGNHFRDDPAAGALPGEVPPYRQAFPDFDYDLPVIDGMTDESWKNDTCPHLQGMDMELWCDYADPAKREVPGASRYMLNTYVLNAEPETVMTTEDFGEVMRAIIGTRTASMDDAGKREWLGAAYRKEVGYNPFEDSDKETVESVAELLAGVITARVLGQ